MCPPVRMSPQKQPSSTENFEVWCEENGELGERLLAEYADPEKGPRQVTYGSGYKASWECRECGHPWEVTISSRTRRRWTTRCPACAGRVATETNNLRLQCKQSEGRLDHLLGEWAHETEAMEAFTPGSRAKVPWKCGKCGHPWEATISNRTKRRGCTGCPECNRQFKPGNA